MFDDDQSGEQLARRRRHIEGGAPTPACADADVEGVSRAALNAGGQAVGDNKFTDQYSRALCEKIFDQRDLENYFSELAQQAADAHGGRDGSANML
eukprot:scaffold6211_cov118-Isochrysis_galbana.AAC.3